MALLDPWGYDGKTYDAKEFRQLIDAMFTSQGVVDSGDFAVTQQGTPNTTVQVAAGQAIVTATTAGELGKYLQANDATMNSPAFTATSTNGRKDRLILRITSGVGALEIVQGTASGSPAEPSITGDNYLELALITLPGSTTNITDAMVLDRRTRAVTHGGSVPIASTSVFPAAPYAGMEAFDTATKRKYIYNGTVWVCITPVMSRVDASSGRTSATYGALDTPGSLSVSLLTGTTARVSLTAHLDNDGLTNAVYMGVAVSGASTIAGADTFANAFVGASGHISEFTFTGLFTGLTAGVNTFTPQYRAAAGRVNASLRHIEVTGLP